MPELPDLTVYLDFLQANIVGQTLEGIRLASPFVLRTADPPLKSAAGKRVLGTAGRVPDLPGDWAPIDALSQLGRYARKLSVSIQR